MASSAVPVVEDNLEAVQLEGLVLLKILKHCHENVPKVVTGQLLGLQYGETVEVTNCFPFRATEDEDDEERDPEDQAGDEQAQLDMMKSLQQVNVDSNTVGWYQSAYLGSFVKESTIAHQAAFQEALPSSVLLVYDAARTCKGRLALKAYRLTKAFMALYQEDGTHITQKRFTEAGVVSSDIFEEIPVKVHNSHLVHAYLYELRDNKDFNCDFDRLNLSVTPELTQNVTSLDSIVDAWVEQQQNYQFYQRQCNRQNAAQAAYQAKKKQENMQRRLAGKEEVEEENYQKHHLWKPIDQPSRLHSHLISHQMEQYCKNITDAATQGFNKMFVTEGLHNSQASST